MGKMYMVIIAAMGLVFMASFINPKPALAGDEKDPCEDVVFSDDDHPEFGCTVAAALDWFSPRTTYGVRKKVEAMSDNRLKRFNKRLERLVRVIYWRFYVYKLPGSAAKTWMSIFRLDSDEHLSSNYIAAELRGSGTKLDDLRNARWHIRRSTAKTTNKGKPKPVQKAPVKAEKADDTPKPAKKAPAQDETKPKSSTESFDGWRPEPVPIPDVVN